jgi:two-component system phosphate regulon response regulator OmpR
MSEPSATRTPPPLPDNAPHVLLVDDDTRIRELVARYLRENGFRVTAAGDAAQARAAMRGLTFDLIILDVMMPGETGLSFADALRKEENTVPILMLTALDDPTDRIRGLETGVDDYMSKPYEPRELLLRIRNILRRRDVNAAPREEVKMGEYVFNIARGELRKSNGEIVKLTERERELMRLFAQRPGATIQRHELIGSGGDATASERAVDVQINRLRRKIETNPANPIYLQTVRGRGYILYTE